MSFTLRLTWRSGAIGRLDLPEGRELKEEEEEEEEDLKISQILSQSCSPHGLVLIPDPTFTKHELLFVLSSLFKIGHTSLSRFRPANNSRQAHFIRQI